MTEVVDLHPKGGVRGGVKTPGSGRRPGGRNKVTKEIAEIAQKHGEKIVNGLMKEFKETDNADLKVKIAQLVLSYGYGQPTKRSEVSGPDGGPIQKQELIINASERVAAAFADVVDADDPAKALDDQGLNAIQAVNFLVGQREAAQGLTGESRGPVLSNSAAQPEAPVAAPESAAESMPDPIRPVPPQPGQVLAFLEHDLRIVGLEPDREGLPPLYALHGSAGLMCRGNWGHVLEQAKKLAGNDLGAFVTQQPRSADEPRSSASTP